jgi:hypothetical protein
MDASRYSADFTVAQVLGQGASDVSAVFIRRKTDCVGCTLAGFCTLEEVANTYGIRLDDLLGELTLATQ